MTSEVASQSRPRGEGPTEPRAGRARTCVACGERVPLVQERGRSGEASAASADPLIRVVVSPDGELAVDAAGGAFGRGAHVHANPECLSRAAERGLNRSFKAALRLSGGAPVTAAGFADLVREAYVRRALSLVTTAARARRVAAGADAVREAWRARPSGDKALLVVVASDARAAADLAEVEQAISAGAAVVLGDKLLLGRACGGAERPIGVLAVNDDRISRELRAAIRVRDACDLARREPGAGRRLAERGAEPKTTRRPAGGSPAVERGE